MLNRLKGFWGGVLCVVVLLLLVAAVNRTTDTYLFEGGIRVGHIDYLFGGSTTDTSVTIGSSGMTKLTVTTADTGNAEVLVPDNSIALGSEVSGNVSHLILCGQADENGTIYLAPRVTAMNGNGEDASIAGTVCDGGDNATESSADAPISALATKVLGFRCVTNGTLGANESVVFTLRTAEGDAVTTDGNETTLTCTIATAATECRTIAGTTTNIAAAATVSMKAVQTSNNADDDLWCQATVAWP